MKLTDRIALITGGTRGIGAATAVEIARHGADVAIVGRNRNSESDAVKTAIEALGRSCEFVPADCGLVADSERCVAETVSRLGDIDILVHAAGGPVDGGLFDITSDEWHAAFDVHLHAIFHLCRAVIPQMRKKGEGAILLVSSVAGIRGVRTNVAYQVVKGALPQFARALAYEFASDNIRVNCVAPGIIRTRFHEHMTEEQYRHNITNRIPLAREGTSDQVADLILELITNDYITGETMTIDGGLTMRIP